MSKQSAGILVYKTIEGITQVLLAHPGGPFWAKKDEHAWSIPKGEFEDGEDPLEAAKREFQEELGKPVPDGDMQELGSVKTPGKIIHVWSIAGDVDARDIQSNSFEMEWPPHSGRKQDFLEIDKAAWFDITTAITKIHKSQAEFLSRLAERLEIKLDDAATESAPTQQPLF